MKQCKTEISDTHEQADELQRALASRAYALFEDNGRKHGRDLDHWLEAERQLHSFNTRPEITESGGKIIIRARVEAAPQTDLVTSVSKERLLIFRAANIVENGERELLQAIPLSTQIEIDRSEAFIDGSDLVVTCSCPRGRT